MGFTTRIIGLGCLLWSAAWSADSMGLTVGSGMLGDTVTVSLDVANPDDSVIGFQVDVNLGTNLQYVPGSAALTSRASGHSLSSNVITGNKLRLLSFSMASATFHGNTGAIAQFRAVVLVDTGTYAIPLTQAVLSNQASANTVDMVNDGTLTVLSGGVPVRALRQAALTVVRFDGHSLELPAGFPGGTLQLIDLAGAELASMRLEPGASLVPMPRIPAGFAAVVVRMADGIRLRLGQWRME